MRRRLQRFVEATAGRIDRSPAAAPLGELRSCLTGLRGRGLDPRRIVDVGAHRGDWSRVAREVFPAARFTLIEPRAEMAPDLERFCAETAGARWVCAGAGREPGELPLAVHPGGDSSSFLASAVAGVEGEGPGERRTVPVVTLEALFPAEEGAAPELVKVDAEGFELEVLAGAGGLVGATEVFILETAFFRFRPDQPTFVEVVDFMAGRGYEPYDLAWFLRRPLDGALGLADVVFARRNGVLRRDGRWEGEISGEG